VKKEDFEDVVDGIDCAYIEQCSPKVRANILHSTKYSKNYLQAERESGISSRRFGKNERR